MGFCWLHWASLVQLLHIYPWDLWACHQSPTLFACIALGLLRPVFTFFHIIHCPWVCYSLFLSFWALLSPFAFSRPIYLFHGPVIHYSYRLDLIVFVLYLLLTSFWSVLLGWASFLLFGFYKKTLNSHQSPTLFACIALGLPRPVLTFFHIIHCLWVCYSLFLSFQALLSLFAFSRPIYLFHGPVIHYSCRLDFMVFVLYLLPTSFRSVLLGWA